MHRFIRAALLATCLLAATAPLALAGPSRMSYQGVLTDNLGNLVPDGNYSLTFTIYDAPVAGTAYWSENHAAVPVVKGGFSVVLGASTAIDVPFESFLAYYLGVQVGADPELTPRIELAGSPSAMSVGMVGDNGYLAGELSWFPSTSGLGTGGGFLHLNGLTTFGGYNFDLEPDFSGTGAYAYFQGYGGSYVQWDGDLGGAEGAFTVGGTYATTFFPGASANDAVLMPDNAVASGEMLDEAGIASGFSSAFAEITAAGGGSSTDLVSVTINTPAPGYVVLTGNFQVNLVNDPASRSIFFQISETSGAAIGEYQFAGLSGAYFGGWLPCSAHRTYYKPAAGSYTFYLQAGNFTGTGAWSYHPRLTALYVPTAYGTVTTIANESQAAGFEHATPVAGSSVASQPSVGGQVVDLRELELRVRREEARLAESRVQLMQARMKEQQTASAKATAMRRGAATPVAPAPKEER